MGRQFLALSHTDHVIAHRSRVALVEHSRRAVLRRQLQAEARRVATFVALACTGAAAGMLFSTLF